MDIASFIIRVLFLEVLLPLIGVVGGVVTFHYIEMKFISRKFRDRIYALISNRRTPRGDVKSVGDILERSLGFFDFLFGKNHWTLRCFLISSIFTLFFSVVAFSNLTHFFTSLACCGLFCFVVAAASTAHTTSV